jgi:hypothetical protein
MDVAAKLAEAQVLRVAIVDDDLSERVSLGDLEIADPQAAALLNDETDPDRQVYLEVLVQQGWDPAALADLAEPLSEAAIRGAAPERLRIAADRALGERRDRAEPVRRVIELLEALGIGAAAVDTYFAPMIPHHQLYDLIIVDYFLVDTSTDSTLVFVRELLQTHADQPRPLQLILMSSHDQRLKADFKRIRPELEASSSRLRIMEKPRSDKHLVSWKAALYQLASDRASVGILERFIRDSGTTLKQAAADTATKLWELDLQAMDLLHELATKDNDDYVRYVEDAISRRLLAGIEEDGGMRASLGRLDAEVFTPHRNTSLLSPAAEIGDSRAAIHGLMRSMEWRSSVSALPPFPAGTDELVRSQWIRKHIRFGMVLRDADGSEWLNITQACDLAQASDDDIGQSTVLLMRGQHSLPAEKSPEGYLHPMSAMMAEDENHVLTWNLRDIRAESIKSFSTTYGEGWQVVGELRPDVAQSIAATFGARAARVGLPVKLSAWHLSGRALRVADIRAADDDAPLGDPELKGYAIERAQARTHELHLDRDSLDALLTAHGPQFDDSVLELLRGAQLKRGKKSSLEGRPVVLYCKGRPRNIGEIREQVGDQWINGANNAERILVVLWCAP